MPVLIRSMLGAVLVLAGIGALQAPVRAQGGQAGTFDQLGMLVSLGEKVTVTPAAGTPFSGRIAALSPDSLTVRVGKEVRTLLEQDVDSIRHRRDDSLANGAAWGLGVGVGAGLAMCGTCHIGPGLMMGGILGGIGAGVGVGVDALIRGKVVVYRGRGRGPAPRVVLTPQLAPAHKAVSVAVLF
jgi:hypothetical protein